MYKFSLGAVLNHRKFLEENLQKELGALKRALADEKKKLADLKNARQQSSAELLQKQQKAMTVSENLLYIRFIEQLFERLKKQNLKVCEAEQIVESKREDLVEAVKKRKAMEILKEKGLKKYNQKLLLDEQNFMNEMASVRFKRKM